jgi:hypothetical protein
VFLCLLTPEPDGPSVGFGVTSADPNSLHLAKKICANYPKCLQNVCKMFAKCSQNVCNNLCANYPKCLQNVCENDFEKTIAGVTIP